MGVSVSTVNASASSTLLGHALKLAGRGFRVFPLYEPVSVDKCSCRDGAGCSNAGKHPRIAGGLKGATTDDEQIKTWWGRWPNANIGIATGDGLFVLDVDNNHDGDETLHDFETVHGELSDDHPRVVTGSGMHYYFRVDGMIRNSASRIGLGLDIRGDGGYVVAAGSTHASGVVYASDVGAGDALIYAPDWLLDLIKRAQAQPVPTSSPNAPDFVVQGARNDYLMREGGSMRRRNHDEDMIFACLFQINKKMCKPPLSESEVRGIAKNAARYAPAISGSAAWQQELKVDRNGNPKRVPGNAVLFLSKHPDWAGVLGYNEMRQRVIWLKSAPGDYGIAKPTVGEQLTDWHATHAQHWLDKEQGLAFSHEILLRAVVAAAQNHPFHPVREYLDRLEWDGVSRIERWLTTYFSADDVEYNQLIGRCWLISAVARVMNPGCQADHVLVLESPQGHGKSTGMAALFGNQSDWYMESLPELTMGGSKDAMAALAGPWCVEIAELDAIKGKASTKTKDFISRRVDEYRPSYGRCYVRYPRQCVFVGTTNQHAWLTDPTGGRRFWPCKVGWVDRQAILRDRDQLWAEAYRHFCDGAEWWPPEQFVKVLTQEQEKRYDVDAWEDSITQYCSARDDIDVNDLYEICLSIERGRITRADQTRVGHIMGRLGFKKIRPYIAGIRKTLYKKF